MLQMFLEGVLTHVVCGADGGDGGFVDDFFAGRRISHICLLVLSSSWVCVVEFGFL